MKSRTVRVRIQTKYNTYKIINNSKADLEIVKHNSNQYSSEMIQFYDIKLEVGQGLKAPIVNHVIQSSLKLVIEFA